MKKLDPPFNLNYSLVNNSQSYEMTTLEDLQWFLFRCIDARHEEVGPRSCLSLRWTAVKVSESDVRKISMFLRSRLANRVDLEVIVLRRDEGLLKEVKFVNCSTYCENCESQLDCLTTERL